jgi:hypothetical protein
MQKNEMGGTYGMNGLEERCILGFSDETSWKETTWKTQA